jgi:hypothetical protein
VAVFLAEIFNSIAPPKTQEVSFVRVAFAEYQDNGETKFFNAEPLLWDYKKRFTKWNSNAGRY